MPSAAAQYLAITRRDVVVRRYDLTQAQHALLRSLQQGATVVEAIAAAASSKELESGTGKRLSDWFRDWTASGCFFVRVVD